MQGGSAVCVDDPRLMKHIGPMPVTERGIPNVVYAHPREPKICYGSGDSVVVRNLEDPSDCFVYRGHNNPVTVAKFSPNGYWVASADTTGLVRVWSWDNPEHNLKVEVPVFSGRVLDLDWDPESKRIVAVGDGNNSKAKVFMWDTGNSVGEVAGHAKRIWTVTYKPNRPYRIMTGCEDFRTGFYTGPPFKHGHFNDVHNKEIWCAKYSPDGTKLVSVGSDKKIVLYDPREGTEAGVLEGVENAHTASIMGCCWSPDSTKLLTVGLDKTAKLWDIANGVVETTFVIAEEPQVADMQTCAAWCGEFIVSLSLCGHLNYLDPANPGSPGRVVYGHSSSITCLAVAPGTPEFVTGANDHNVIRWSPECQATKVMGPANITRAAHTGRVAGVAMIMNMTVIVSAGWDDKVRWADASTNAVTSHADVNGQPVALAASQEGLIAVTTTNGIVQFFRDGASLFEAPVEEAGALAMLNEEQVAVGCGNVVKVYSINLGEGALTEVTTLEGRSGAVTCLAYAPDASMLAVGDASRLIKVWTCGEWTTRISSQWCFHSARVNSVCWDPTSSFCVSGSADESVILWNPAKPLSRKQIRFAHKGGVTAVSYIDATRVVSAGLDGCIAVWNMEDTP